jgi:hypothetical protein
MSDMLYVGLQDDDKVVVFALDGDGVHRPLLGRDLVAPADSDLILRAACG